MQNKGLIALVVVAVASAGLAVAVARGGAGAPENDPLAGSHVLSEVGQRMADITRVTLVRASGKTTLVQGKDGWTVEEKNSYPADATKVHAAVLGLADLTFVEPKTRQPSLYPRLEVEDADKPGAKSVLVTVSGDNGSLLGEIIAGKRKVDELGGGNDGIYVRKPGDAQSWLARGSLDVSGDTTAWLATKLMDVSADQIKNVILTSPDGGKLAFGRAKAGDPLSLVVPVPAGKKLKSDDPLSTPAGALAGLELSDVRTAKDFAMPPTGVFTARYETMDGLVVSVTLTENKDGTDWALINASGTGAAQKQAADLEAKLGPWVFGLPSFKAKMIETKLDDLVEPAKGS